MLIKASTWLWPGSMEATLMLLQSSPSTGEIIRGGESCFSTITTTWGSTHSTLWGRRGCIPCLFLPITNNSGVSTQHYPSWQTADSRRLLLSVSRCFSSLAYMVLWLTLSFAAAGISISADSRESGGREDGLTDDYWKLGSGKNECVWELLIKQTAGHRDTFHGLCQSWI